MSENRDEHESDRDDELGTARQEAFPGETTEAALVEELIDESELVEELEHDTVETLLEEERRRRRRLVRVRPAYAILTLLLVFGLGLGGGYAAWGMVPVSEAQKLERERTALSEQVHPAEGFTLPVRYGDIGPKVIAAGGIDEAKFVELYKQNGKPLGEDELAILHASVDKPIVINSANSYFLLNFFWAVGLTNKNPVLEEGPMVEKGRAQVGNFASTGGWTIGAKSSTELYSSAELAALTPEQQARLEEVAKNAYRPCCGNSTYFPDCNHGMALLGLLELMAAQDASIDEMYTAAKQVNAFWYPEQMLQVATYIKVVEGQDFAAADSKRLVSAELFSGRGYQQVFQQLAEQGLIPEQRGWGQSCGV